MRQRATTPEEWERQLADEADEYYAAKFGEEARTLIGGRVGFTWDDVDILRSVGRSRPNDTTERETLLSLADRIAALLPPRR